MNWTLFIMTTGSALLITLFLAIVAWTHREELFGDNDRSKTDQKTK